MLDYYENLAKLLQTFEETTGLEVCIYPSRDSVELADSGVKRLPHSYFSHFGEFCRIVKANRTGRGCGGHDSRDLVAKSAEVGKPFVNICHAGLGEVIFPVYGYNNLHIASVFVGQVITEEINILGFPEIRRRTRSLGVDETKLEKAFGALPRMSREKLLRIGEMLDLAVRGMGSLLDFESFESQIMLAQYPAIRRALRMMAESSWTISEAELAEKLNLHQSYFSRLFKKVVKCNFQTYIIQRRVQQARVMLHHTETSILQIASNCGFASQAYFTRQFKKVTGMTPTEFRKRKTTDG